MCNWWLEEKSRYWSMSRCGSTTAAVFVESSLSDRPIQVAGRGTRRQDYVDVRDAAQAVESCLCRRASGLFNIGGGRSISNRELAEMCRQVLGSSSQVDYGGRPDPEEGIVWDVSIVRAGAELGYRPQHDIEHSIRVLAAEHAVRQF